MKKLLLLLSLLLATNAWAVVKTLECEVEIKEETSSSQGKIKI